MLEEVEWAAAETEVQGVEKVGLQALAAKGVAPNSS